MCKPPPLKKITLTLYQFQDRKSGYKSHFFGVQEPRHQVQQFYHSHFLENADETDADCLSKNRRNKMRTKTSNNVTRKYISWIDKVLLKTFLNTMTIFYLANQDADLKFCQYAF